MPFYQTRLPLPYQKICRVKQSCDGLPRDIQNTIKSFVPQNINRIPDMLENQLQWQSRASPYCVGCGGVSDLNLLCWDCFKYTTKTVNGEHVIWYKDTDLHLMHWLAKFTGSPLGYYNSIKPPPTGSKSVLVVPTSTNLSLYTHPTNTFRTDWNGQPTPNGEYVQYIHTGEKELPP